ncbi:TldD/PmbA family protein [Halonatronum saccharophilum]|uniref:TldD/PmbA family protein n=1 Tax=Halonatronum saccharophilum TaxID=150060 RepID=UPI000486E9F5|nr:TldD/PmbA family protein [Halonatronum saccharophilum]
MSGLNLLELIDKAKELGAQDVEFYYQSSIDNSIEVYEGDVESLESAHSKGLGIRVFLDNKMGFAYTADFNEKRLEEVIKEAIANAQIASEDEYRDLAEGDYEYDDLDIYDPNLEESSPEDKIDLALQIEKVALDYDQRIESVISVGYGDSISKVRIVNSKGLDQSYKGGIAYAYLYVLASDGEDKQTGSALTYGRNLKALTPVKTGEEGAKNALDLLGGKQVKSQKAPVVFTPKVGAMFMYVLAQALTAESVQKGRSLFAGKLDKTVANERVNIIDNGSLEEGLATAPFDGEGVPSKKTDLIKEGILTNYLYDIYTANKDGVESTANASRGSYRGIPSVSPSNFYLAPGDQEAEDIIKGVENGFYLHKVSGLVTGGANPISGDFSVGATGQWIKGGEIKGAVNEVTIAGNLIDFLKNIEEIGNDLKFNPSIGSYGSPTFKVRELAISGA